MLASLALSLAAAPQGCGCWEVVSTADFSTPLRRHECGGVEVGGDLILMGGRGFRTVDRYDPVSNTWTNGAFAPDELHHFQPVLRGDTVWILSAFTGNFPNEPTVPEIRLYDPALDSWSTGPTIPSLRRRGSAGAVLHEDAFYVVGGNTLGHDGGAVAWFDRYDPNTDTWTVLPDAPHARDHFSAHIVGNKLYCAGGRQTALPQPQANTVGPVDVFDFSTGTWSTLPFALPTERAGTVSVVRGEHLIVAGGESPTGAHDDVEALDVLTHEWTTLPSLVLGRHGAGGARLADTFHLTAGVPNLGGSPELNSTERIALGDVLTPSATNLLVDPEFDLGVGSWNGTPVFSSAGSISPGALGLDGGTSAQQVPGTGLRTYRLRGVHRSAATATLNLTARDGGGALLDQTTILLTTSAAWASFSADLTTPAGTVELEVELVAPAGSALEVDDLALIEKPGQLPYFGNPANAFALPTAPLGPVLGTTFTPAVDHSEFMPGSLVDVLLISGGPTALPLFGDLLLIDPVGSLIFTVSPPSPFSIPIPSDPALTGTVLWMQAASADGLSIRLTNGSEITLSSP